MSLWRWNSLRRTPFLKRKAEKGAPRTRNEVSGELSLGSSADQPDLDALLPCHRLPGAGRPGSGAERRGRRSKNEEGAEGVTAAAFPRHPDRCHLLVAATSGILLPTRQ